jgi:hypothetical protein
MNQSFLGECIMVLENSVYNQETPFLLPRTLGSREVAITQNLAAQYGVDVGSVIYSKHNVKNQVEAYVVVEILPVCYGISNVGYDINHGVILMGYDRDYKENTDYPYLGFSADDPSALLQRAGTGLISLNSKQLSQSILRENIFIWQGIILLFVTTIIILYICFHWKNQKNTSHDYPCMVVRLDF